MREARDCGLAHEVLLDNFRDRLPSHEEPVFRLREYVCVAQTLIRCDEIVVPLPFSASYFSLAFAPGNPRRCAQNHQCKASLLKLFVSSRCRLQFICTFL